MRKKRDLSHTDVDRAAVTGLIVFAGMALFEVVKHRLWPHITVWTSHIITILFNTLNAAGAALYLFRKQSKLHGLLEQETRDRIAAAETLRQSEEKYHDLFQNANDAIMIVDVDLHYREVNTKAMEILGYSKEELLSMRITDIIPPEQAPRSAAEFEKLRNRGSYERFTGKVRTRDGRWLDVEVNSSAIMENGVYKGSRDTMRDITLRKQAEAEREHLIQELQKALTNVKTLSGMLPICASCKKIRDDKGYWTQIEGYIREHTEAEFTHGLCPDCARRARQEVDDFTKRP